MSRNAVLCYLMGATAGPPPDAIRDVGAEPDGTVLFALCCARAEDVDGFATALDGLSPDEVRLVSSYCLMLGLSGRVQTVFMLFDALKPVARECPAVWLDLSRLQAAWNYLLPALRSETMYRRLLGQDAKAAALPRVSVARTDPGPIHILDGDLPSVRRV